MDVDERPLPGERPSEYVLRVALEKARASSRTSDEVVLAADTAVVVDGLILGKPSSPADAARMLRLLSGRVHAVLTGVAIRHGGRELAAVESTTATFADMSDDEIDWYVSSGEPSDKAGAYAIQGLASRFVARIDGSYSNVVGLPVERVRRMLMDLRGPDGHGRPDR